MKIYDEMKIRELTESEINLEMGYLKPDKHIITHEAVPAVTIETQIAELQAQGISIMEIDGKLYRVNEVYENGSKNVTQIQEIPAKDAWEEYADIQVYVPYSAEELKERHLAALRSRRTALLVAFDKYKSNVDYGIERETQMQHENMIAWYEDLLDLEESAFENVPERIGYYL